jgi:chemotaxis protein CheZ
MLDSYRAQIAQCEKLKVELDLIHDAINRTKQEIAVLHGTSFSGDEMSKVTGELGAVVGGTEEATQQILEAAESIDQAAAALGKIASPEQQAALSEDIQERVVSIFEACNFQDLTGQRISKVMNTMKFIEHHINVMMDIWGGVDAIKVHAPAVLDTRVGDDRLLNGPKMDGDEGHASQNDIDALFN